MEKIKKVTMTIISILYIMHFFLYSTRAAYFSPDQSTGYILTMCGLNSVFLPGNLYAIKYSF